MVQFFDLSTTVDPSYIISLIRKLLPSSSSASHTHSGDEEEAWEESGCILWDLAASKTHAQLMVYAQIT